MNLITELDELSRDLRTASDPSGILHALVDRLVTRYDLAVASVWRMDAGNTRLTLAASAGNSEFPISLREISASHSPLGRAAQAKAPQLFTGAAKDGDELSA